MLVIHGFLGSISQKRIHVAKFHYQIQSIELCDFHFNSWQTDVSRLESC